jgi:UDP-GlcNAc:undecaprenyl-phosphate GlcNAc-1-phosphate transferase
MSTVLLAVVPASACLGLTMVLLPVIRRVADRKGWYDPPDHRKLHVGKITHLGGVGIFSSFAVVVVAAGAAFSLYSARLAFLLLGAFSLHVIGLVDDLRNLRALPRLVAHLVIAGIVTSGGFLMRTIAIPGLGTLELGYAAYPVTILWIAGVVNAMNWSDGVDGYAGGIAAFAALGIGIIGLFGGNTLTVILAFGLFGALVAFLISNFPPARIFMGDNGSTFIGFLLAVLPFVEESDPYAGVRATAVIVLLLLPLLDFVTSIIRRIAGGRSPGSPDRGHLHHRLLDLGLRPRQVLAVVYPLCAYLGVVALAIARPPAWLPRPVVVAAFIATLVLGLVLAIVLANPPAYPTKPQTTAPPRPERRAN